MDFYLVMAGVGSSIACGISLFLFFVVVLWYFGGYGISWLQHQ
jgi:hypothetical protein